MGGGGWGRELAFGGVSQGPPPPGTNPTTFTVHLSFCSILKFEVGISMDAKKLTDGLGVQLFGCVDLQHIAVRSGIR